MRKRTCTRKVEFDSAHRVMLHESKCKNLHGHRYVAEITAEANELDPLGRVIDFSVLKQVIGSWIDEKWDHGTILHEQDFDLIDLCKDNGWKYYVLNYNPTAENMSEYLFEVCRELLAPYPVDIKKIRLYETPNCWADYCHHSEES